MPAKNILQIKIWKSAHAWLKQVSDAYKARGDSSMSMTLIASQLILSIPMPTNGSKPEQVPVKKEEEK